MQFLLGLRVAGMLLEKFEENRAGFLRIAFNGVDTGESQIALIVVGREADTVGESFFGLFGTAGPQVENSQIIESFGISGASRHCFL